MVFDDDICRSRWSLKFPIGVNRSVHCLSVNVFDRCFLESLFHLKMASILSRRLFVSLRHHPRLRSTCLTDVHRMSSTQQSPMMLMTLPHLVYPNIFLFMRNLISRAVLSNYLDKSFAIQPFYEGARQALTVVSRLIGNGQFEDMPSFVTQEVEEKVTLSKRTTSI